MEYKMQFVFNNCIKNIVNTLAYLRPEVCIILCPDWKVSIILCPDWKVSIILCPDWKVSINVNSFVFIPCMNAMLYGCVSPRLSGTQCKYKYVMVLIFCACVVYYWYKVVSKYRCAMPNLCDSPCWYSRPKVCAIDTLCFYRCASPCWHGFKCIYYLFYTSTLYYICIEYNWYKLCLKSMNDSTNGCDSPHSCGTSYRYGLSRHTP